MATARSPQKRRTSTRWVAILLAVTALVAASCGGDDSDSDGASGTGSGGTAAEGGGAAASGEPIKVMVEAPVDSQILPYPNIPETGRIFAEWKNANGGINGRPLEVIACDDRADAGEAANCARKAVSEKVVANVGSFTLDISQAIPIYEENNIAWFGECCPLRELEFTSPVSFALGFINAANAAAPKKMTDDGCKNIVGVFGDDTAAEVAIATYENGFKAIGADAANLKTVKVPIAPGDYSAQAAQINDPEADCVYGYLGQVNWPPLITALSGVGASPRYYGPQGNLDETIMADFPEETEGAVVIGVYPNLSADVWEDFRFAIEEYDADPELNYNSLAGLGTWTAFTAFSKIVEGMEGEINNETFLEAASNATEVDTGGMVGTVDFTKEFEGGGGQFPRIFNRAVFYDVVEDGKLVAMQPDPEDMSNALDGKPS